MHASGRTPHYAQSSNRGSLVRNGRTETSRHGTHLRASSGARPVWGCGTPTARSRPQHQQMWLITSVTDLGFGSFVRLFQGLSWFQVNGAWCCSSSLCGWTSPLPRLSPVWHPEGSHSHSHSVSDGVVFVKPPWSCGGFLCAVSSNGD